MYKLENCLLYNGCNWTEGSFGKSIVKDLLSRNVIFLATCLSENKTRYLIDEVVLKRLSKNMTLETALLTAHLDVENDEELFLKHHGFNHLNIIGSDYDAAVIEKQYPFVFNNKGVLKTDIYGNRFVVPEVIPEMRSELDYTLGAFEGIEGDVTDFSWQMDKNTFTHSFLIIGRLLIPVINLFTLNNTNLRLKQGYNTWFIELVLTTREEIPLNEIGVSKPYKKLDIINKDTIKRYFQHNNVNLFIVNTPYPATFTETPISRYAGLDSNAVVFYGEKPTTHRNVSYKYHNELSTIKDNVIEKLYDTSYKTENVTLSMVEENITPVNKMITLVGGLQVQL